MFLSRFRRRHQRPVIVPRVVGVAADWRCSDFSKQIGPASIFTLGLAELHELIAGDEQIAAAMR